MPRAYPVVHSKFVNLTVPVSQIPAHAEHDDLLVKVSALEESVHFRVRSSALSFDRFANDYAVSSSSHQSRRQIPESGLTRRRLHSGRLKGPTLSAYPQLCAQRSRETI